MRTDYCSVIRYLIGHSGHILVVHDEVVSHIEQYRQSRRWTKEAGGQLFATFEAGDIIVRKATGPRPTDKRGRNHYRPDRRAERLEIEDNFARGLHFVGDWHTHAQAHPTPSESDLSSIRESVQRSDHQLNGFLLMILGQAALPSGLYVAACDAVGSYPLPAF